MNFNKKLLTLLAIFCVIASAGFVCAADNIDSGSNSQDGILLGESVNEPAEIDSDVSQDDVNQTDLEPGAGLPLENQTAPLANETGNATGNTTGNTTDNATANTTANTTGNATVPQHLLATGNPILALLAVSAIMGSYAVIKRNK